MKTRHTDQEIQRMTYQEKLILMDRIAHRDAANASNPAPEFHYTMEDYAAALNEQDDMDFYEYWKERGEE